MKVSNNTAVPSAVRRFTPTHDSGQAPSMREDAQGAWVPFAAHAQLLKQHAQLQVDGRANASSAQEEAREALATFWVVKLVPAFEPHAPLEQPFYRGYAEPRGQAVTGTFEQAARWSSAEAAYAAAAVLLGTLSCQWAVVQCELRRRPANAVTPAAAGERPAGYPPGNPSHQPQHQDGSDSPLPSGDEQPASSTPTFVVVEVSQQCVGVQELLDLIGESRRLSAMSRA
ncbi:hypothetical protein D3C71_24100 [compost metagenome]